MLQRHHAVRIRQPVIVPGDSLIDPIAQNLHLPVIQQTSFSGWRHPLTGNGFGHELDQPAARTVTGCDQSHAVGFSQQLGAMIQPHAGFRLPALMTAEAVLFQHRQHVLDKRGLSR